MDQADGEGRTLRAVARGAARALSRRARFRVVFLAIAIMATGGLPGAAQETTWNGTWVGNWQTGHGAQIIFAGNEFIGIYWQDDYVENAVASLSADGKAATITWPGAGAVLTRDGPEAAHIVIRETGRPDTTFPLTLDH